MNTLAKLVTETIDSLEKQNQPQPVQMEIVDDTPPWLSDAERQGLPTVNRTTGSGAPLLNRDEVLRRSYPNHTGRK